MGSGGAEIDGLIEVAVDSIRVHMPTGQHVVILKEKGAERYLPIWIGVYEANAIALKITGITPERPITHDLVASTFGELAIKVNRIVVTSLADEVFFARLFISQNGRELDIDSRPSDAIALAVRFECPIFVARDVLDRAETVLAIEALCAAQGLDFRAPMHPGPGLARAHARLRERVPHLTEDRSPSPDIAAVRELVHSGDLLAAADGS